MSGRCHIPDDGDPIRDAATLLAIGILRVFRLAREVHDNPLEESTPASASCDRPIATVRAEESA